MSVRPDPQPRTEPRFSLVLETSGPPPEIAHEHFRAKLRYETDPADVYADLHKGPPKFVLVDARSRQAFEEEHIPGAVSLPHREINAETSRGFSQDTLIVTYCWGPACNASTKAAVRLSALGFRVKEMIGGIEYWKKEGYPVSGR